MIYDLYLRENIKKRPAWTNTTALEKKEATAFYRMDSTGKYFPEMQPYNSKKAAAYTHIEKFMIDMDTYEKREWWALFNYHNRDPLTYDAHVWEIKE